jgi:hypothetical protein
MTPEEWKDYNLDVVVRCGYCGALLCFYPHRVIYLGECKCGNDNWGSPCYDWPKGSFGDFDLPADKLYQLLLGGPRWYQR